MRLKGVGGTQSPNKTHTIVWKPLFTDVWNKSICMSWAMARRGGFKQGRTAHHIWCPRDRPFGTPRLVHNKGGEKRTKNTSLGSSRRVLPGRCSTFLRAAATGGGDEVPHGGGVPKPFLGMGLRSCFSLLMSFPHPPLRCSECNRLWTTVFNTCAWHGLHCKPHIKTSDNPTAWNRWLSLRQPCMGPLR